MEHGRQIREAFAQVREGYIYIAVTYCTNQFAAEAACPAPD